MDYATAADLETYIGAANVPADADRMLSRASETIDNYLLSPFEVDELGEIVDVRIVDELRKATCAQVEYWLQTGDEADVLTNRTSVSFNGAMFMSGKGQRLAPRAADALRRAGLLVGAEAS